MTLSLLANVPKQKITIRNNDASDINDNNNGDIVGATSFDPKNNTGDPKISSLSENASGVGSFA